MTDQPTNEQNSSIDSKTSATETSQGERQDWRQDQDSGRQPTDQASSTDTLSGQNQSTSQSSDQDSDRKSGEFMASDGDSSDSSSSYVQERGHGDSHIDRSSGSIPSDGE